MILTLTLFNPLSTWINSEAPLKIHDRVSLVIALQRLKKKRKTRRKFLSETQSSRCLQPYMTITRGMLFTDNLTNRAYWTWKEIFKRNFWKRGFNTVWSLKRNRTLLQMPSSQVTKRKLLQNVWTWKCLRRRKNNWEWEKRKRRRKMIQHLKRERVLNSK